MDKYKWGVVTMLPDGHRLFPTTSCQYVAIADDSGREPQDCEDGILWLDRDRSLIVNGSHIAIPVIDEGGEQSRTPSDVATILYLACEFNWSIEDQRIGKHYSIR